jgi:restriction endonuclease S subunit
METEKIKIQRLGDVFRTTSGGTPSRRNPNFYNGTIPWVKSGELESNIILDAEEKISEDAIKNSSEGISKGHFIDRLIWCNNRKTCKAWN